LSSEATGAALPQTGGPCFSALKHEKYRQEKCIMTKAELTDNLTFVSALQMLARLVQQGLLTADEEKRTRRELERRLRPTLFLS